MDFEKLKNKAVYSLKENVRYSLVEAQTNFFDKFRNEQKKVDIISATGMLLHLNVKKDQIYELLNQYFGVESIDDAREYLIEAKIRKQRKALRKSFASGRECSEFEKAHKFYDTLKANPELLDLTPEKLKKALEKY